MLAEKKALSAELIDAQAAFELPDRAMMQQAGLVNVEIGDVTVAVPVAIAANICGLDVNVLATQFVGTEQTACEADADAIALVPPGLRP